MLGEACVAKLPDTRRAGVETSADDAGAAVATLASIDLDTVTMDSAYHTKLTEIRRSSMISG